MASAFHRVTVSISPLTNYTLVEWSLDNRFTPQSGTYTFYIEVAYSAGTWTRLNPGAAVSNLNYYYDTTSYKYGTISSIYYRVVLEDGSETYISDPVSPQGDLSDREFRIVRGVLRQEYKRLNNYAAGTEGWLLRRKHWGEVCPSCVDYDLENEVSNSQCSTCYGTGIVGGYYDAYPYSLDIQAGVQSQMDTQLPFGVEDKLIKQARGVAYPLVYPKDIWVAAKSNTRYLIRIAKNMVEVKEVPVIYGLSLHEIPAGRIEYSVPLTQTSSSSSSADTAEQGWRVETNDILDDM